MFIWLYTSIRAVSLRQLSCLLVVSCFICALLAECLGACARCSQILVSSVEELDLFHEQAVGVPLLMRIWVEFTTNDYIGAPQPDVHFEGSH